MASNLVAMASTLVLKFLGCGTRPRVWQWVEHFSSAGHVERACLLQGTTAVRAFFLTHICFYLIFCMHLANRFCENWSTIWMECLELALGNTIFYILQDYIRLFRHI